MSSIAHSVENITHGATQGILHPFGLGQGKGILGDVEGIAANVLTGGLAGFAGGAYSGVKSAAELAQSSAGSPNLTNPTTTAPNPVLASTTAIQSQLSSEQNARSTGSILTAPSGLTDEPTTTSSLLTGA